MPDGGMNILERALSDFGLKLNEVTEKLSELSTRQLEIEQKGARGGGGGEYAFANPLAELAEFVVNSDHTKSYVARQTPQAKIQLPAALYKAAILNATGQNQPLVPADRRPGMVFGPQRRLTIRDLLNVVPTSSNLIEWVKETLFTNNAGPQYDGSSPAPTTEGALKNESAMTFELVTSAVITLAHWIAASRQVLADAPMLQRHLDARLMYGLKLVEEDALLNGDGTSGNLSGLLNQATTFTGGVTNASAFDTLARSIAQLVATDYTPTGFILNPRDWWSTSLRLAKDSEGRYLLGDPQQDAEPRLWGLPAVLTNSMPQGEFATLDGPRTGFIADREDANVQLSEHHSDFFVRNLVAIRCESRLALIVERPGAIVAGNLSNAG